MTAAVDAAAVGAAAIDADDLHAADLHAPAAHAVNAHAAEIRAAALEPIAATRRPRPVLVRLPDLDPPFDDEADAARRNRPPAARPGTRDLPPFRTRIVRRTAQPPSLPAGEPTLVAASQVPRWSEEADVGVLRTGTAALPPARRTGSVLARALVEVLSGRRPVAQLRIHCSPEIYEGLTHRPPVPSVALPHLISVRVGEPADGVAEVCAVFRRSERVRAIAFRLAGVDGRWRVTALQVG